MTESLENEVNTLCSLSEGVFEKGRSEGFTEGQVSANISRIQDLMDKLQFSLNDALDFLILLLKKELFMHPLSEINRKTG